MFSGFPNLPLAAPSPDVDFKFEMTSTSGCVRNTHPEPVKHVRLGFAALMALAAHAPTATGRYSPGGKLMGIQIGETLEITGAHRNAQTQRGPADETDEQREAREAAERQRETEMSAVYSHMLRDEEFDTYHVGNYVITSACSEAGFLQKTVNGLVNLAERSHPAILIVFDPFRTGLLGKPYLRAFAPTAAYVEFAARFYDRRNTTKENKLVREAHVPRHGVLREVNLSIDVDMYQMLSLQSYQVKPLPSSSEVTNSPAIKEYMEALLQSVKHNSEELVRALGNESYANQREGNLHPLGQRVETLLKIMQLKDQAAHLEALCDGILLSTTLVRDAV